MDSCIIRNNQKFLMLLCLLVCATNNAWADSSAQFGILLKGIMGAVIANQTGDQTLLNQAVQEAISSSSNSSLNQAQVVQQSIQQVQKQSVQTPSQTLNNSVRTQYAQIGSNTNEYNFQNGNESGANSNTSNKKFVQPVTNCISLERTSNSLADFFINRCSQNIWVE